MALLVDTFFMNDSGNSKVFNLSAIFLISSGTKVLNLFSTLVSWDDNVLIVSS